MSAYNRKDMTLLQEAYAVRLLKEQIQHIDLESIKNRVPLMCESELNYLNEGLENILEVWGGLKAIGGAAKKGIGAVGSAIGKGVSNVAGAMGRQVGAIGQGAAAAGRQLASNVGNIYKSGEKTTALSAAAEKANELIDKLVQLVAKYEPTVTKDQLMAHTLQDVLDELAQATQQTKAGTPGFTQGIGQAAKQGYQAAKPVSKPVATPPPLPAGATA